jgi:hypothetical protein
MVGGTPWSFLKLMTMTKVKLGIATVSLIAVAAGPLVLQHQSKLKLLEENRALRRQVDQLGQLEVANQALSNLLARPTNPGGQNQLGELLRLRAEVSSLKKQLADAGKPRERVTFVPTAQPQVDPQEQQALARLTFPKSWMLAFALYAEQNQGQCPASFEQAAPFLPEAAKDQTNVTPSQFEIVYQGSLHEINFPQSIIIIREKEALQSADGGWQRAYGFADGHSELHRAVDGNFEPWEAQHMISTAGVTKGEK